MRTRTILGAAAGLALTSCAGSAGAENARIRSEIQANMKAFVAAVNALDADRAFAQFSTSGDFRVADNGRLLTSRDALAAVVRDAYRTLASQDRRLADEHIHILSRDLVMYTVGGTFTLTDKAGKTTLATPVAWTFLWHREGEHWKVINAHVSYALPAAP